MPDKWEYPWYAAWDLAFHTTTLALVDYDFAKEQLLQMIIRNCRSFSHVVRKNEQMKIYWLSTKLY